MTPQSKKRKRLRDRENDCSDVILKSLRDIEARREERRARDSVPQQDEEDLFAQQVASILRRLPRRKRALMKINIQQMLYQAEFDNPGGNPHTCGCVYTCTLNVHIHVIVHCYKCNCLYI